MRYKRFLFSWISEYEFRHHAIHGTRGTFMNSCRRVDFIKKHEAVKILPVITLWMKTRHRAVTGIGVITKLQGKIVVQHPVQVTCKIEQHDIDIKILLDCAHGFCQFAIESFRQE